MEKTLAMNMDWEGYLSLGFYWYYLLKAKTIPPKTNFFYFLQNLSPESGFVPAKATIPPC
jgi:hypothetical protein